MVVVAGFLVLVGLMFAFNAVLVWGTGRNRTVGPDGSIRPLRTSDWFDVPHHMSRSGRRAR